MKTMIQIAILAAILIPDAAFANPHGGKHHRPPPPVHRPPGGGHDGIHPIRRPPPPPPAPVPPPGHHKHHRHHHPAQVIYVVGGGYAPAAPVVRETVYETSVRPDTSGMRVLSTREFLNAPDLYRGQRVAVHGKVTQSVRGMCGVDYVILDGALRCEFPRDVHYIRGAFSETNRYVTVVGTAVGGWHATASADLVECDRPF